MAIGQNQKSIGGKFMIIPFEVYDILCNLERSSRDLYISILRYQYIHEDWESDENWVVGHVRTTNTELIEKAPIGEGTFYGTAWPELKNSGLIIDVPAESEILITMLKKKPDVGVSSPDLAELRRRIELIEELLLRRG